MYIQRKRERRDFSGKTSFPMVTNGGYEVEKDRRSNPDRRLGNIHLELINVADHGRSQCIIDMPFYSSGNEGC